MKFLVVLALLFACSQAEDMLKKAIETVPICAQETGADVEKIKEHLKGINLPVDDDEFTKFFTCYYTKLHLLKDNGEVDIEKVKVSFPQLVKQRYGDDSEKIATDAIEHCEDAADGSSGAKAAIKFRNCALKYVKEHHK